MPISWQASIGTNDGLIRFSHVSDLYLILFMPPPIDARGIMFSGCQSICLERFLVIFWRTDEWNGIKYGMLMYPDPFKPGHILAMVCWLSSVWHHFDLMKLAKFYVSGNFLQNAWEEWCEIWYAGISWSSSELMRFWLLPQILILTEAYFQCLASCST